MKLHSFQVEFQPRNYILSNFYVIQKNIALAKFKGHFTSDNNLEGIWKNGSRDSIFKCRTTHYNSIYEGQKLKYASHGFGIEKFFNGGEYTGNYRLGSKRGYGIMKYKDGKIVEGYWKNYKAHHSKETVKKKVSYK